MRRSPNKHPDAGQLPCRLSRRIPMVALIQTLAVAEYLNFRHAADALGVSQSSVSARIRALEDELGVRLFERHTRGVRLTDVGSYFVKRIASGVDLLDHAVRTAAMTEQGQAGRLRIGIYGLIPGSFLARLLARFRKQYPDISISIAEGTCRTAFRQLRSNQLDVAFTLGTPELPDCHSRQLWSEALLAAFPLRHPLAGQREVGWADLAAETFLVRQGGTGPQIQAHICRRLADRCPAPSILRFEVGRGTLLSLVAQGQGITIAGAATTSVLLPGIVFRPVADEPEPLRFSAVWSPRNHNPSLKNLLALAERMRRETGPHSLFQ